jgi:hypothetical protein
VRLEFEQRFSASVADVAAAFLDAGLPERLCRAQTLCRVELVERVEDETTLRQKMHYTFIGAVSPAVSTVVDANRLTWVEDSVLDRRSLRRQFTMIPDHYPDRLSCSGIVEICRDGTGTTRRTHADLEVRVPIFGAKVADAIASGLRDYAEAERRVVQDWLDEGEAATVVAGDAEQAGRPPDATETARNEELPPRGGSRPAEPNFPSSVGDLIQTYGRQWNDALLGVLELGDRTVAATASIGQRAQDTAEQVLGAWAAWRRGPNDPPAR